MSAIDPPLCKVCGNPHWSQEGHQFGPRKSEKSSGLNVHEPSVSIAKSQPETGKRCRQQRINSGRDSRRDGENTEREGRDVVKPKGTSTERDHREARPAPATQSTGKRGKPEKPAPGKRKTGPKGVKK